MSSMTYVDKFQSASRRNGSLLCVGLDTDRVPNCANSALDFNRQIVEATKDLVAAYKVNLGFYEQRGADGIELLKNTVRAIPRDIPVIADGKRCDIANSARAYASAVFDALNFDAITVSPLMGLDSIEPFLRPEKFVFVLCRTSNPGARDFQDLLVERDGRKEPLFLAIAGRIAAWGKPNVGLVVGATYPDDVMRVRQVAPETSLLIPGVGAQGGSLREALAAGLDSKRGGVVLNVSRQVIYAGEGEHFADRARESAIALRNEIEGVRSSQAGVPC